MRNIITTTLAFMALIVISSCSNDVENSLNQQEKVIVEKTSSRIKTRAAYASKEGLSTENKDLYSIKYKDINLKDIPLRIEEVNMLSSASSISAPIPVSVKGYSEWTVRTNGNKGGDWYKLAISSKIKLQQHVVLLLAFILSEMFGCGKLTPYQHRWPLFLTITIILITQKWDGSLKL